MKKGRLIILIILALVAVGAIAGSSEKESKKKDIVASETSNSDLSTEAKSNATETESTNVSTGKTTVEEQVLLEDGGLKVTAVEYTDDSFFGEGIKCLVENNGTSDIGLSCTAVIVNDYMITDLFSSTVVAGKKDYETITLMSSQLKAAGIENVGKIEIYFHTFDPDTFMTQKSYDCVTVKTSKFDSMDMQPNDVGQELYNQDGIRIVGKYVDENSFWGTAILLYVENNSGKNRIVQCDDVSVNGFMMTPLFSCTVYDGKKAIDDITLLSSELKDKNITSVDDIELKFKVMDENFMNATESDTIRFSAK